MPPVATWGGQGKVWTDRQTQGHGHMTIRVCGWSALKFRGSGQVSANHKSQVLVSATAGLCEGTHGQAQEAGETRHKGC